MQTQGGVEAEKAINSDERNIYVRVLVDWNRNGGFNNAYSDLSDYVEEITTDRALSGALPEELMLIEGASAAELDMVIGGRDEMTRNITTVFSAYNRNSPLYGKSLVGSEVKYDLGVETAVGIVWYPQFVGNIRSVAPDRVNNSVRITALDRVEQLRKPVILTSWAMMDVYATRGIVQSQLIESHWLIDNCLRSCDTSATKYRPSTIEEMNVSGEWDGVQFWMTGNGGAVPTIGWVDGAAYHTYPDTETSGVQMYQQFGAYHPNTTDPSRPPQAFNALGSGTGFSNRYWVANRYGINPLASHYAGFTLVTTGPGSNYYLTAPDFEVLRVWVGANRYVGIWIGANQVWARWTDVSNSLTFNSTKLNIPASTPGVRIRAGWDSTASTGFRLFIAADNTGIGWESRGAAPQNDFTDSNRGLVYLNRRVSLNDIYYNSSNTFGDSDSESSGKHGRQAKYTAVLDRGKNRFSYIPERNGDEAWKIITDTAAAEFGSVFWDESGVFQFWNFETMLKKQNTVVKTLTLDNVSNLSTGMNLDSVRNQWVVEVGKQRMIEGIVYEARDIDEFYIPASTRKKFRLWVDDVVTPNSALGPRYTTVPMSAMFPQWTDDIKIGYVVQFLISGVWQEYEANSQGLDITSYKDPEGALIVDVWNGYPQPARFATNAGQPAFRWNGSKVTKFDDQKLMSKNVTSVKTYGGRTLELNGDFYHEYYNYTGFVGALLSRSAKPTMVTDSVEVIGDPRIQLGDTMRITDPDGFGEQIDVQVYGIRRTISRDGGLVDTLTVEVIPARGFWDDPVFGLWDQTFIWS